MSPWRGRGGARGNGRGSHGYRSEPFPRGPMPTAPTTYSGQPGQDPIPAAYYSSHYPRYTAHAASQGYPNQSNPFGTYKPQINNYAQLHYAMRYENHQDQIQHANYSRNAQNDHVAQPPPAPLAPPPTFALPSAPGHASYPPPPPQNTAKKERRRCERALEVASKPRKVAVIDFVWRNSASPIKSTRVLRPWGRQTERAYFALNDAGEVEQTFPKCEIKEPAEDILPESPPASAAYKSALSFQNDAVFKPASPIPKTLNSFINLAGESDDDDICMDISDSEAEDHGGAELDRFIFYMQQDYGR